ncbi:uncharacterized protein RCH25_017652 [Pelodytes ibericus]
MFSLLPYLVLFGYVTKGDSYSIQGCEVHGSWLPKVLCYNQNLTHVPAHLPQNTWNLDISFNRINIIKAEDFNNLTFLQVMNISNNEIRLIDSGTFQKLEALRQLNLSSNKIESLKNGMFEGLQNLTKLSLDNNQIVTIEYNAFSGMPNLKTLGLSSNRINTLEAMGTAFQIGRLEGIHIANSSLQHFSTNAFSHISTNLSLIDASYNSFSTLSIVTDILQTLNHLDISFNKKPVSWNLTDPCFLRGLNKLNMEAMKLTPTAVSKIIQSLSCSSLEEINLGHLHLTDSDLVIQKICLSHPKIKIIQLQGNNYTEFRVDTFLNCTFLKVLDVSHNFFEHVPMSTFQHLGSLQQLSLSNNMLSSIPADLSTTMSLERMDLSYNHLSVVFLNESKSYNNLKSLDLSGNKMYLFYSSSLGVWHLQSLNLGDNHLLDITHSFKASLKLLDSLWLRKNKLSSLSSNTFKNLISMKYLNLIENQIEEIENGAFVGLGNLHSLLLGSNKLTQNVFTTHIFDGLQSLYELQLFSNYLHYDSSKELDIPPFLELRSLKLITLNSQANGMENLPANMFDGLVSLEKVHAGNLALIYIDPTTFTYTPNVRELDISNNHFLKLDPKLLQPLSNLSELHINHNNLGSLDFLIKLNNSKLALLRAIGNQLNILTSNQIEAMPSLSFLDLRSNPLTCGCKNQWFINWVQSDVKTQVLHFYEYECAYPSASKGKKLSTFDVKTCSPDYEFILFLSTCLLISNMLVILTIWKYSRWQLVYGYYILLAFLYDRKQRRKKQKYEYDAFISYNSHDEEWVFNQLVPNLEEFYGWKLCLHHRDFEPGKAIIDNVIDSIYNSRKTICIISSHYLESEWCSKEIQVASYRLFDDHADVLVLLFLEDIPSYRLSPYHQMRKLVKKKTYLIWPKDINAYFLFWFKVNKALENNEKDEEENNPLLGVTKYNRDRQTP